MSLLLLFGSCGLLVVVLVLPNLTSVVSVTKPIIVNNKVVVSAGVLEFLVLSSVDVFENSFLFLNLNVQNLKLI